jgi:ribosomal protein S18 acetylase RimI-like enzyme
MTINTFPDSMPLTRDNLSIELFLDAPDGMVFAHIPAEYTLENLQQLVQHLKTDVGGKTLLLHSKNLPYDSTDKDFSTRVMYLKDHEKFDLKTNTHLNIQYQVSSDKKYLLENSGEISDLLINHADWAGKADHKRRLYGPEALQERIKNNNVVAIGIFFKEQIIGFARVYIFDKHFAYFSDIVIDESYRHQGLMTALMHEIRAATKLTTPNLLLIAGTPELVATYQRYGFALSQGAVTIDDEVLEGFATSPKNLLKAYQDQFGIPECPKKYL